MFAVWGTKSLLWSSPQIPSTISWLSPDCHVVIAPMGTSCPADCYCSIQTSLLGNSMKEFPPLEACMGPSGTRNGSQQGGSFPVSSSLIRPWPVTKAKHIFLNQASLGNTGLQQHFSLQKLWLWYLSKNLNCNVTFWYALYISEYTYF